MPTFREVTPQVNLPTMEQDVLRFWKTADVFHKTLEQTAAGPRYVFYEGPPTANGRPGIHHVLARAFKDIFPRYKTMHGYYVLAQGRLGHARPAGRARGREASWASPARKRSRSTASPRSTRSAARASSSTSRSGSS